MIDRLDHGCKAAILSANADEVLLSASWPAAGSDYRNFFVNNGLAYNTVIVSREYFERRYGVSP